MNPLRRLASAALAVPLGFTRLLLTLAVMLFTTTCCFAQILYGPTYYESAVASSTFQDDLTYSINNVFDSDLNSQWASWANDVNGNNPQGNQEVWFSFNLVQSYTINAIRFAPRVSTGVGDGISGMKVWISGTYLGVDVQSGSETSAFLSTTLGLAPTLNQLVNISNPFEPATYSLPSSVEGQYLLVQLTTDVIDSNQNIGAREFVVSVPEPSIMALAGIACGGFSMWRRRRPTLVNQPT